MKPIKGKHFHIVYPHQLFEEVLSLEKDVVILIVEDPLFFRDKKYPRSFHKHKLILHRASMKIFQDELESQGKNVEYFDFTKYPDPKFIKEFLIKKGCNTISIFDPIDHELNQRIKRELENKSWNLEIFETPAFITYNKEIDEFFSGKKYLMSKFYIYQRRRLNILLLKNKSPVGGKWSFDELNRKKLPKNISLPAEKIWEQNLYVKEAIKYVDEIFPNNPGDGNLFNYPTKREEAKELLEDFIENKLKFFGVYEDAISTEPSSLFHSKLSAPLNIGLLSPKFIVKRVLEAGESIPLASLEGFIRQIIGWREFMRAVYLKNGVYMRTKNFLGHKNKMPKSFYSGETGILPVDNTIKKIINTAYCHHIERLMILGNFMLLTKINPLFIYEWFMEMFIDAYDWVMVPNVYAMSQFADGGTITTKPYFSSSNYILKMSNYKKGKWCEVWDALFYIFLDEHREIIEKNPRLGVLTRHLDNLSNERMEKMKEIVKNYYNS